jgi:hypothetical protein
MAAKLQTRFNKLAKRYCLDALAHLRPSALPLLYS